MIDVTDGDRGTHLSSVRGSDVSHESAYQEVNWRNANWTVHSDVKPVNGGGGFEGGLASFLSGFEVWTAAGFGKGTVGPLGALALACKHTAWFVGCVALMKQGPFLNLAYP